MGWQVTPRGTFWPVGIPAFLAIGAPFGVLEFTRLLQQYCFAVAHWTELFKGYALTVDKGSPGRENIPVGDSEGTSSECGDNEESLGEHF